MTHAALLDDLLHQLEQCTGLRLEARDRARVEARLRELAGGAPGAWLAGLAPSARAAVLERLAGQLTPGETFFFRDHGQFDLLRLTVLPELIERRRAARRLRLWSAGCASGEEAYSLALLIDMLLPMREDWRLTILGSDINPEALDKARRAVYGRWSFRAAPEALLERYFERQGDFRVLDARIRRMVEFRHLNLVADPLPEPPFAEFDLIVCRNVLIYFSTAAITRVAARLAACLAEDGYLLVGHTELQGHAVAGLASRLHPEGVVYRRAVRTLAVPAGTPPPPTRAARPRLPAPARAAAPARAPQRQAIVPEPAPGAVEHARQLADRGSYSGAEAACREALAADPMIAEAHFLLAQLAQLRGDYGEAQRLLERTLYLEPERIAAWLELAALHERAGASERARSRRRTALELLHALPPDTAVAPFEASAGEIAAWLQQTEALG